MEDQYGFADLRQYIGARPNFYQPPPPPDLLSGQPHPYDLLAFRSDSTAGATTPPQLQITNTGGAHAGDGGGGDGGAGRWPRQETLTLLEIRSRLDPKFKEANQKGHLWDEVSRIMFEEHGYQRSGKKCREKFENLYKYYKKTREGKAGRQDGKHYRFFRQLEALYGETNSNNNSSASNHHHHRRCYTAGTPTNYPYNNLPNNNNNETLVQCSKLSDNASLSISSYSDPDISSYDDDTGPDEANELDEPRSKKRSGKTGWKRKIKDFIDSQMKKMMEKQEAWMEKMMATIEHRERERLMREEEWRKQDTERIEREHKFWAGERAWIEARDAALMEALHKLTGKELMTVADIRDDNNNNNNTNNEGEIWAAMDVKFEGLSERGLCEEKWDSVSSYLIKCDKKRKENSKSFGYYDHHHRHQSNVVSNQVGDEVYGASSGDHQQGVEPIIRLSDQNHSSSLSSSNNNNSNGLSESCFGYFRGDATNYGRIME